MKRLFHFVICIAIMLAVSSCSFIEGNKSQSNNQGKTTAIESLSPEIKNKIVEQDSLMRDLVNKVDTLTGALNDVKKENAELKEKIETLKSPKSTWGYMTLAAIVLSILAVIVAFLRSKGINKEQVGEQIRHALDESRRINKLQDDVELLLSQRNRTTHQSSNYASQYTETRILKIENTLDRVVKFVNGLASQTQQVTPKTSNPSVPSSKEPEYQKVGYAKNDRDMYFTTIYDSNQEGCVFKITFTSPTKGKFNIVALDKIQSRNDWQQKVECSGISIKEASDFRVEEEGICEKIDENTWQVTKPLKIRLLK